MYIQCCDGKVKLKFDHMGLDCLLLLLGQLRDIEDNATHLLPPDELASLGANARHRATEATL